MEKRWSRWSFRGQEPHLGLFFWTLSGAQPRPGLIITGWSMKQRRSALVHPSPTAATARGSVLYEDCGSKQQQPLFFFFFSLTSIHLVLDQPAQLSPPSLTSPLTRSVRPDLVLAWTRFPWNPIRCALVFVFLLLSNIRLLNLTSTNPPTKMLF